MVTKGNTRAGKGKVKDLKARSLSVQKAKGVKGGLAEDHAAQKVQKVHGINWVMGDGSVRYAKK